VTALDEVPNESDFSDDVSVVTDPSPYSNLTYEVPPRVANPIGNMFIEEDTINTSIDLSHVFFCLDCDSLRFEWEGQLHIKVEIDQGSGVVTLTPEEDWNGAERITFMALADTGIAEHTAFITVTAVNDPPSNVVIVSPENNSVFEPNQRLEGYGLDVDRIYGDNLTYLWHSDIGGYLGYSAMVDDVNLKPGVHWITLTVTDLDGAQASSKVTVLVEGSTDTKDDVSSSSLEGGSYAFIVVGIALVAICLIFVIILRKKSLPMISKGKSEKEPEPSVPSRPPPQVKPSANSTQPVRYRTVQEAMMQQEGGPLEPKVESPVPQEVTKPKKGPQIIDAELVDWPIDDSLK